MGKVVSAQGMGAWLRILEEQLPIGCHYFLVYHISILLCALNFKNSQRIFLAEKIPKVVSKQQVV